MVVAFSNNVDAQKKIHEKTLYEIANQTSSNKTSSISVGASPSAIGVNQISNTIYVVNNKLNGTVSVINDSTNRKIDNDIPVGKFPTAIGVNQISNTIYLVHAGNGTVSVIYSKSNKVVAGVTFNIKPIDSGNIICSNLTTLPL